MGETTGTGSPADEATWDGSRVRKLRRYLDETQAAFAERLGTRQQTVSEWERGKSHPRRMARRLLQLVAQSEGFCAAPGSVLPGSAVPGSAAPGSAVTGSAAPFERVEAVEAVASTARGSDGAEAELEESGDGAQREAGTDQRDGP